MKELKSGKILLYSWQPYLFQYLSNQYYVKHRDDQAFLETVNNKKALAFMDFSPIIRTYSLSAQKNLHPQIGYNHMFQLGFKCTRTTEIEFHGQMKMLDWYEYKNRG